MFRYSIQLEQEDTAARVRDEDTNSLVIQFKNTLGNYTLRSESEIRIHQLRCEFEFIL